MSEYLPTNRIFVDGHGWCDVWSLPKVSPKKQREGKYIGGSFLHPAKMDVVLCRKIIETYTKLGEVVLDPMSGIGTTLVEAALMGRDAIGVELERPFVGTTQKNIKLIERTRTITPKGKAVVIKGDSRELSRRINKGELKPRGMPELWKQIISKRKGSRYSEIAHVDAVITSPPYSESMSKRRKGYTTHPELSKTRHMGLNSSDENIGNLRHGEISQVDAIVTSPPYEGSLESTTRHTKDNIGSKKGETYLQAMLSVYRECFKVLKLGGRMVLVLKDFVRNKKVVRLDLDTKRLCEAAGFRWVETKIFKLPSKSFWRTLYERKYPEVDTSLLQFEFCEVFERPNGVRRESSGARLKGGGDD